MTVTKNNSNKKPGDRKFYKATTKLIQKETIKTSPIKTVNVSFQQTNEDEGINYNQKGRNQLQRILSKLNGGESITFLSDNKYKDIESKIKLAPVAVLKNSQHQFFGVYSNTALKKNLNMGEYLGEKLSTKGTNETTNVDYSFDLNNKYEINAKRKRSWHSMVNGTSADKANIFASRKKDARGEMHIYYYAKRDIQAGEQLLVDYGDDYKFSEKRFLNPTDNWEDSAEKIKKNAHCYQMNQTLSDEVKTSFGLIYDRFAVPYAKKIDKNSVSLPVLAFDQEGNVVPQAQQDNMTLLTLACFNGDIELVKHLFTIGADPNQQTSITGLTPLHCVVMSKIIPFERKKKLIDLILEQPSTSLKLQDKYHRTVLHLAIETEEVETIKYLLDLDKTRHPGKDNDESLRNFVNEKMQCYLLLAIEKHNIDVLNTLKDYIFPKDIAFYLPPNDKLLVTALNDACENSTYAQWCAIERWIQDIAERNPATKDELNKLIPTHKNQSNLPDVVKKSKVLPVHAHHLDAKHTFKNFKTQYGDKLVSQTERKRHSVEIAENAKNTVAEESMEHYPTCDKEDPTSEKNKSLSQIALIKDYYNLNGAGADSTNANLKRQLSSELLEAIGTHWKYAFCCASQSKLPYEISLFPFCNHDISQKIKKEFARYNDNIDLIVDELVLIHAKLLSKNLSYSLTNIAVMMRNMRISYKAQFNYLYAYYQSESEIVKEIEVAKPIKISSTDYGQIFFRTVELDKHHLYRKDEFYTLWFLSHCKFIEYEIKKLGDLNSLSFFLFKNAFDELNQLLEIEAYFRVSYFHNNIELNSELRAYIANYWEHAFITAVFFDRSDIFFKDNVLNEDSKKTCLSYNGDVEEMVNDLILYAKEHIHFMDENKSFETLRFKLRSKLQELHAMLSLDSPSEGYPQYGLWGK